MQLGLIGYPLSHSWSPDWYRKKFSEADIKGKYKLFPLTSILDFPDFIRNQPQLDGFNITTPFKTAILPFLDELDPVAISTGAVNTVTVTAKKEKIILKGYNTDAPGFEKTLPEFPGKMNALILGTGGAAKAVTYILEKQEIPFILVSRRKKSGNVMDYASVDENIMQTHRFIINTTPAGMFPDVEKFPPLPYGLISKDHFLYDLIYNPPVTRFLEYGVKRGAATMNGLQMLINQAELAFEIFYNHSKLIKDN